MGYLRTEYWANGDSNSPVKFYVCDSCGCEICEAHPHIERNSKHYCWGCAFVENHIVEGEYLRYCGGCGVNARASVYEGKVVVWFGKVPPWDRADRAERCSPKYLQWRTEVLKRDEHTCQKCGASGCVLHAHHIEPFSKNKKKRYEISNGVALCEKCHKEIHYGKTS